ncbi:MAG TPA: methyltransferase domain-containing protein [Pyrinomonadaceae bacterium]|nr:methyltransferase domain-containing protein [Pyrinomonadaceae bacterium]
MISQTWKDLWYVAWAPVLKGNLYRHRLLNGHNGGDLKLNIGCGTCKFSGWTNIDGNFMHKPDMWLDVTGGLPFKDASVKVIYACHFFEHLHLAQLRPLLTECRRVLRDDGALRVAVPNLRSAIVAYQEKDKDWFSPFPQEFKTLGGRFFNDMLCGDQHRLMFDFEFLGEVLTEAGFRNVVEVSRGESAFIADGDAALKLELAGDSGKKPDPWLIVEATN